jgi:hypothetical protein
MKVIRKNKGHETYPSSAKGERKEDDFFISESDESNKNTADLIFKTEKVNEKEEKKSDRFFLSDYPWEEQES